MNMRGGCVVLLEDIFAFSSLCIFGKIVLDLVLKQSEGLVALESFFE